MSEDSLEREVEKDMEMIQSIISAFIKQLHPAFLIYRRQDDELGAVIQRHEGSWSSLKATIGVHLIKTRSKLEEVKSISEKISKGSPQLRDTAEKVSRDCEAMMKDLLELKERLNKNIFGSLEMFEGEFHGGYVNKRIQFMKDGKILLDDLVKRHKEQLNLKALIHKMFKGDLKNL